ncbi:MAG: hypothetical protein E7241_01120 [Lachnospiraceae bacterium]|jgi:hypothetical protein|nr:hypothetical protein [Lachnospiraceae bacterium]
MTLTSDLLKNIISNSESKDDLNDFFVELCKICGVQNEALVNELRDYLCEEYGISSDNQLRLASIDIKNDICDFVNSKAA